MDFRTEKGATLQTEPLFEAGSRFSGRKSRRAPFPALFQPQSPSFTRKTPETMFDGKKQCLKPSNIV
jgi:hypothetical protein